VFTGIVETIGRVREARAERGGVTLLVEAAFASGPLVVGESVATAGPCLTVERVVPGGFEAFASAETLAKTTLGRLKPGDRVNLERALRADGRLGGHIVSGHVDGVGRVRRVVASGSAAAMTIAAPDEVRPFLAAKGSVAIDGVSLTVNAVAGAEFTVMLVPHTRSVTTLAGLRPGDEVNVEADVIARYVAALLGRGGSGGGRLHAQRLAELGIEVEPEGG
jgi:riboflavin synthase